MIQLAACVSGQKPENFFFLAFFLNKRIQKKEKQNQSCAAKIKHFQENFIEIIGLYVFVLVSCLKKRKSGAELTFFSVAFSSPFPFRCEESSNSFSLSLTCVDASVFCKTSFLSLFLSTSTSFALISSMLDFSVIFFCRLLSITVGRPIKKIEDTNHLEKKKKKNKKYE